jgi:hypothetical protein
MLLKFSVKSLAEISGGLGRSCEKRAIFALFLISMPD